METQEERRLTLDFCLMQLLGSRMFTSCSNIVVFNIIHSWEVTEVRYTSWEITFCSQSSQVSKCFRCGLLYVQVSMIYNSGKILLKTVEFLNPKVQQSFWYSMTNLGTKYNSNQKKRLANSRSALTTAISEWWHHRQYLSLIISCSNYLQQTITSIISKNKWSWVLKNGCNSFHMR